MDFGKIARIILNVILIMLIMGLILAVGYLVYNYYPRAAEILNINYHSKLPIVNASSTLIQFAPNMRFNHNNITYFIMDCELDKISRLNQAFFIIENETKIITFREIYSKEDADITVSCSAESLETEKNVFISGEGGPTKFLNLSIYPLILKGKVILYEKSSCNYPITELHEIFHVLGFDHINDSKKIMYPYVDCKQRIDLELINSLIRIYSIEPLAEIYFLNASGIKSGLYLNFSVKIINEGLVNAEKIILEVYEDNRKTDVFDLKDINSGITQGFWIGNMKLNSLSTKEIKLKIITKTREYSYENNVVELKVV